MTNNNYPFGNPESNGFFANAMNKFADRATNAQNALAEKPEDKVIRPTTNENANKTMLDIFYEKLEALGMNLAELKPILENKDPNLQVIAIAGAGKTTMMVLKLLHDIIDGSAMTSQTINTPYGPKIVLAPCKILISTFLKTGADDIRRNLHEWVQKLGLKGIDMTNIKFKTIHAEVLDAIKTMGVNVSILEDTRSLIREVANRYNIKNVTSTSNSITLDEVHDIESIIGYARNRLDSKRYQQQLMPEYRMDKILLDTVLQDFAMARKMTGKLDFEDLQEMVLEAAKTNANVAQFLANRYDYVYVDEFQDTSQLQYEVLKYYFKNSRQNIIIGDDDQTIYSFRGSDSNIITKRFIEDFQPTILKLTTNYRCGRNILDAIKPSIETNKNRLEKDINAYRDGGLVNLIVDGDINHLVKAVKQSLVAKNNVGVLARVNDDLLMPTMLLELDNSIEFTVSKSVSMEKRLPRQVFGSIDLVTKRVTEDFTNLLRSFVPRYKWYEVKNIVTVLNSNGNATLYNIPIEDIENSCPSLAPFIKGLRQANEVSPLNAYMYVLGVLENNSFRGQSNYAKKGKELIRFTRKLILEHDKLKELDIYGIDNLFNQVLPYRIKQRIKYAGATPVRLTTVHEAKGKEWDSVFIWNDCEGIFPFQMGQRALTDEEIEEERRVHYIAATRAKKELTIYTYHGREGQFLKEMDYNFITVNPNLTDDDHRLQGIDAQGMPTTIYRKKPSIKDESANYRVKIKLTEYMEYVNTRGTQEESANQSYVLTHYEYSVDKLVETIIEQYGVHVVQTDDNSTVLNDYFKDFFDREATRLIENSTF